MNCSFGSEPASALHFAKLNVEPRTLYLVDKLSTTELLLSPRARPAFLRLGSVCFSLETRGAVPLPGFTISHAEKAAVFPSAVS